MIKEDYVSFETAKLLKEKGYCNISDTLYKENSEFVRYKIGLNNKGFSTTLGNFYEAPTLQMAMKWLREVHNIHIEIAYNMGYFPVCISTQTNDAIPYIAMGRPFTYEVACEVAIKYCLKNLI